MNTIKRSAMAKSQGFTLIELLIVVAIIAILAAIAVPNFPEAQVRAKVSRAKADMRTIATCAGVYQVDNNRYPPSNISPGGVYSSGTIAPTNPRIERLAWLTTPIAYCSSIQKDPFAAGIIDTSTTPEALINNEFPVFTYWDPDFLDARKQSPTAATDFEDFPSQINRRSDYLLLSYGPDRVFHPAAFFHSIAHITRLTVQLVQATLFALLASRLINSE